MKKTEKLKLTIDNLCTIETTFDKLPEEFRHIAEKLENEGNQFGGVAVVVVDNSTNQSYCVGLDYAGKVVKPKNKLFGYTENEFLSKQY